MKERLNSVLDARTFLDALLYGAHSLPGKDEYWALGWGNGLWTY